ncbi:MAG: FAD-binding protein [Deltaproteobacteria bacterium]|nr:FAD-binding protein [Deltaproteobacteria bacterium]
MQLREQDTVTCDVLIVGGGGAALRAAIEVKKQGVDVLVASKSKVGYANNTYISASVFAASGLREPEDGSLIHLRDTVVGGRFINDQKVVDVVTREAKAQVEFLDSQGVAFAEKDGDIRVDRAPGHSYARHVRTNPSIGRAYMLPLKEEAQDLGVRFMDRAFVTRLFEVAGKVAAASAITDDGGFMIFRAKCIILTCGGYAQIYRNTDNAAGITGDGQALAFHLGLPLKDMEFVQFYPTSVGKFGNRPVLYEAIVFRGGAKLRNAKGEDILIKYNLTDPMLVTRDRLSRAIMDEIIQGLDVNGSVILDLNPAPDNFLARVRSLLDSKWSLGPKELLVSPTTHFCMGGVVINRQAETSIPGLFAAGEVCGGVHGANRLAGNALTEVWVMGGIAAREAAKKAKEIKIAAIPGQAIADEKRRLESLTSEEEHNLQALNRTLKEVMWIEAGVLRNHDSLNDALTRIKEIRSLGKKTVLGTVVELKRYLELQNMLLLSEMVCRAGLLRTESRGSHFRSDFPNEDNAHWLENIVIRKRHDGMALERMPVAFDLFSFEELRKCGEA